MTSPGSSLRINPTVTGWKPFQGTPSLETAFNQRLDSSSDRVGVQAALGGSSCPSQSFATSFQASIFSGGLSGSRSGDFLAPPEGGRRGNQGSIPRVFRPPFLRTEVLRGLPTSLGPFSPQQIPQEDSFSHGNRFLGTGSYPSWRLGHFSGPDRCIFPYSYPSSVQEVAQVRVARESLPIQGTPVRAFPCPLGFYPYNQGDVRCGPRKGHQAFSLPRRLVDPRGQSVPQSPAFTRGGLSCRPTRFHSQRKEILPNAFSVVHFSGDGVRHAYNDCPPVPRKDRSFRFAALSPPHPARDVCTYSGCASGADGVSGSSSATRSRTQEGITAPILSSVVPDLAVMGHGCSSGRLVPGYDPTMDSNCLARGGGSHLSSRCSSRALHGRFPDRVGCACRGPHSLGPVAAEVARCTYQCSGDASCLQGTSIFCSRSAEQDGVVVHRQYHRCLLREQRGGDALNHSVSRGRVTAPFLPEEQDHSESQTHCREGQYSGRFSKSPGNDPSDRMDTHSFSPSPCLGVVVQTHDRPVCDSVQQKAPNVRLSRTRPHGHRDRRTIHDLGGPISLCLPSSSYSGQGDSESQGRPSVSNLDCSPLASPIMVPRVVRTVSSSSTQTRHRKKRLGATKVRYSPRRSRKVMSSRLALVRQSMRTRGASRQLCDLVSKSHRSGTNAVYSSHWKRWVTYCTAEKISPSSPSEFQLGSFLAYLFKDCKLSSSSVRGYRSAICTTLRQLGAHSFPDSSLFRDLFRAASEEEARTPKRLPAWDLFLVLASLREPPYEPLFFADLESLTHKTVFLLALASGRRASEVCHLSGLGQDIAIQQDGSFILKFLPEFLAKNQTPSDPSPSIRIRPLTDFLCPDDPDRKLCPVRALKRYLKFTRSLRKSQRQLFISHNPFYGKDITSSSISRWLKLVIKNAYASSSMETESSRAHEVRAWAASSAFAQSWCLREVMEAVYWRSESSFTSFYLRDVSLTRGDGTRGISTFVAAQQVVQPRRC